MILIPVFDLIGAGRLFNEPVVHFIDTFNRNTIYIKQHSVWQRLTSSGEPKNK